MLWYCWLGSGVILGALLTVAALYVIASVAAAESE
jgi:hypothetical protein